MKKTFIRDMLGILCGIAGIAVLGGVQVTVSATLLLLAPAALLLLAGAGLLAAPVRTGRKMRRSARSSGGTLRDLRSAA